MERHGPEQDKKRDRRGGARVAPVATLLRFAVRTGRYVAGATGAKVRGADRRTAFVAIAADLDPRKAAGLVAWAEERSFPVSRALTAEELGDIAGRASCDVVLVYDPGLVRSLTKTLGRDR